MGAAASAAAAIRRKRALKKMLQWSPKQVEDLADTFDILLIRERVMAAGLPTDPGVVRGIVGTQREGAFALTRWELSGWNNAGMVVIRDGVQWLLEGTPNGVELFPFEQRLRFHMASSFRVALRKVTVTRTPELLDAAEALCQAVTARGGLWWTEAGASLAAQRDAADLGYEEEAKAAAGPHADDEEGAFGAAERAERQLAFAKRMLTLMRRAASRITPQQHVEIRRAMALAEDGDLDSCPREAVPQVLRALLPHVTDDDALAFQGAFHSDRVNTVEFERALREVPRKKKPFEVNSQLLLGGGVLMAAYETVGLVTPDASGEDCSPVAFSSASTHHLPLQHGAHFEPEAAVVPPKKVKKRKVPKHLRL